VEVGAVDTRVTVTDATDKQLQAELMRLAGSVAKQLGVDMARLATEVNCETNVVSVLASVEVLRAVSDVIVTVGVVIANELIPVEMSVSVKLSITMLVMICVVVVGTRSVSVVAVVVCKVVDDEKWDVVMEVVARVFVVLTEETLSVPVVVELECMLVDVTDVTGV
jgi:hypothetical protein